MERLGKNVPGFFYIIEKTLLPYCVKELPFGQAMRSYTRQAKAVLTNIIFVLTIVCDTHYNIIHRRKKLWEN